MSTPPPAGLVRPEALPSDVLTPGTASFDAWMQYAQGYSPSAGIDPSSLKSFKNRKRSWR